MGAGTTFLMLHASLISSSPVNALFLKTDKSFVLLAEVVEGKRE